MMENELDLTKQDETQSVEIQATTQPSEVTGTVASCAATLLTKMLVRGDFHYHCIHVSTEFGTLFTYSSPKIIREYLKAHKFEADMLEGNGVDA